MPVRIAFLSQRCIGLQPICTFCFATGDWQTSFLAGFQSKGTTYILYFLVHFPALSFFHLESLSLVTCTVVPGPGTDVPPNADSHTVDLRPPLPMSSTQHTHTHTPCQTDTAWHTLVHNTHINTHTLTHPCTKPQLCSLKSPFHCGVLQWWGGCYATAFLWFNPGKVIPMCLTDIYKPIHCAPSQSFIELFGRNGCSEKSLIVH